MVFSCNKFLISKLLKQKWLPQICNWFLENLYTTCKCSKSICIRAGKKNSFELIHLNFSWINSTEKNSREKVNGWLNFSTSDLIIRWAMPKNRILINKGRKMKKSIRYIDILLVTTTSVVYLLNTYAFYYIYTACIYQLQIWGGHFCLSNFDINLLQLKTIEFF